jgi:hypothetical protein
MPKRSARRRRPRPAKLPRRPVLLVIRRFIPADVLQIITEYTDRTTSILHHRSVSRRWYRAVGLAVSFLNDRNSTSVGYVRNKDWVLRHHFKEDDHRTVLRCCVLCMRERLEQLRVREYPPGDRCRQFWPTWALRLIGGRNDALKRLWIEGIRIREVHLSVLRRYTALHTVWLVKCPLDDVMLEALTLVPALKSLHIKRCKSVRDVSILVRCQTLRELALNNLRNLCYHSHLALARIRTLTSLSLGGCEHIWNVSALATCPTLETLDLTGTRVSASATFELARMPALRSIDFSHCCQLHDVSSLRSSASLQALVLPCHVRFGKPYTGGLELLPMLQKLDLCFGDRDDVAELLSRLQLSTSLQHLVVRGSKMSAEGGAALQAITGIRALRTFDIGDCAFLHDASWLKNCTNLRSLGLHHCVHLVDSGIEGFGCMPALTELNLKECPLITTVACLGLSTSLRALNLSMTSVTSEGIAELERIPSLTLLDLDVCTQITSVTCLRSSRSLRVLNLSRTGITTDGLAGLSEIPTLRVLGLRSVDAADVDTSAAGLASIADFNFRRFNWLEETDWAEEKVRSDYNKC